MNSTNSIQVTEVSRKMESPKPGIKILKITTSPCVRDGYRMVGLYIDILILEGKHQARVISSKINSGKPFDVVENNDVETTVKNTLQTITDIANFCGGTL